MTELALLDTAAEWSVIDSETAEDLDGYIGEALDNISISTRHGTLKASLHRTTITLLAEHGEDIEVEATVAVMQEWPGPAVLGFRGFLENIRIALDPGTRGEQWFYFGSVSGHTE